jgi:hypothetical protein
VEEEGEIGKHEFAGERFVMGGFHVGHLRFSEEFRKLVGF